MKLNENLAVISVTLKPVEGQNCEDEFKEDESIKFIVLHDIKFPLAEACNVFEKYGLGAHYYIDQNGQVHQLIDPEKKAFHAGPSKWQDYSSLNGHSIGIETQSEWDYETPEVQIDNIVKLVSHLQKEFNIPAENILSHAQIAPFRINNDKIIAGKTDPGINFPWAKLSEHGIGYYPKIEKSEKSSVKFKFNDKNDEIGELQTNLLKLGYSYTPQNSTLDLETSAVLSSLYLRYYPEWFKNNQNSIKEEIIKNKKSELQKNDASLEELELNHLNSEGITDQWLFDNTYYFSAINIDDNTFLIIGDLLEHHAELV